MAGAGRIVGLRRTYGPRRRDDRSESQRRKGGIGGGRWGDRRAWRTMMMYSNYSSNHYTLQYRSKLEPFARIFNILSELFQHISSTARMENPHNGKHDIAKTRIREINKTTTIQAGMPVEGVRTKDQLLIHVVLAREAEVSHSDETGIVPNLLDVLTMSANCEVEWDLQCGQTQTWPRYPKRIVYHSHDRCHIA